VKGFKATPATENVCESIKGYIRLRATPPQRMYVKGLRATHSTENVRERVKGYTFHREGM
jgi:hypothetical protein